MEAIHQRLETIHIGSICIHAVVGYHFVTDHHLQIIPGQKLAIFHVVFLEPHVSRVMVCLGIAVSVLAADRNLLRVALLF